MYLVDFDSIQRGGLGLSCASDVVASCGYGACNGMVETVMFELAMNRLLSCARAITSLFPIGAGPRSIALQESHP